MAGLINRGGVYYALWHVGGKQRRISLKTDSLQVAKEKVRNIESKLAQGTEDPLPSRTPIGEVVAAYVTHIRTVKTAKSAQTDVYFLRQMLGPCCPEIQITSRCITLATAKRPSKPGTRPRDIAPIEAACIEHVTTAQVADFIGRMVRSKGLAPKTANRYREILTRMFNWAMKERRIRMPGDINPVARVERYREPAPEIRYLTLPQIEEQLAALEPNRQLQTMVAMYIYARLRREEALWLTADDVDLRAGAQGMIRIRAKTIEGSSWQPKTKVIHHHSHRTIPRLRRSAHVRWVFQQPANSHTELCRCSRPGCRH